MTRWLKGLGLFCFILLLEVAPACAQQLPPPMSLPAIIPASPALASKIPNVADVPFIQNLRNLGASLYYLGESFGLHGWFVVKDKEVQLFYTTPDQRGLVVGALLAADGTNISQQQMLQLAERNQDIEKIIQAAGQTSNVHLPDSSNAAAPLDPAASPAEQFYAALLGGATLTFGQANAPQLVMVMDVNCVFCHRTWQKLQPLVEAGALRVTLFPIAALGLESETEAAVLLGKKDPYAAWKSHVAGDTRVLKTAPPNPDLPETAADPARQEAVKSNSLLVYKWHIRTTPTLLYRGKNNKIRLISGEPASAQAIMDDILR